MALDPISAALGLGDTLIKRLWPDPAEQDKAKLALMELAQSGELQELTARAGIVQTEAGSEHWLTSTWRPITMLTLLAMLVGYWFDVLPDAAYQRITSEMFDQFVDLLKIGIGGYVASRGAEKFAKAWKAPT